MLPHVHIDKDPINIRAAYEDFNHIYINYKIEYGHRKRMVYLRNTLASMNYMSLITILKESYVVL